MLCVAFFFQAEDGIRNLGRSRGLGDGYKRPQPTGAAFFKQHIIQLPGGKLLPVAAKAIEEKQDPLSLIHI